MASRSWKAGAGALKGVAAALLLVVPALADARGNSGWGTTAVERSSARQIDRWSLYIAQASARFAIPQTWIRRVMRAESGGRTRLSGHPITSSAGAMGLMQLMPRTWAEMRAKHGLGPDPHNPRDNILAGAAYLRALYDRFGYPGLFAAYNAGPRRYAEHLESGRRLPAETVAYLAAVGAIPRRDASFGKVRPNGFRKSPAGVGIFVSLLTSNPKAVETPPPPTSPESLFVPLRAAAAQVD